MQLYSHLIWCGMPFRGLSAFLFFAFPVINLFTFGRLPFRFHFVRSLQIGIHVELRPLKYLLVIIVCFAFFSLLCKNISENGVLKTL